MREFRAKKSSPIFLGLRGENNATKVIFNISDMIKTFGPNGTVSLLAKRANDDVPYPCVIEQSGTEVFWKITNADSAHVGKGSCELRYTVDDTLAKSETWRTIVMDAIGEPSEDVPEPYQDFMDQLLAAAEGIKNNDKKLNIDQGVENAGKLLFVDKNGKVSTLTLGSGLVIQDGVLHITSVSVTAAILGSARLGNMIL